MYCKGLTDRTGLWTKHSTCCDPSMWFFFISGTFNSQVHVLISLKWIGLVYLFFPPQALASLLSSTPIHHCNINYIRLVFPACLHPHPCFQIFFPKVSLFLSFFFSLLSSSDLVFPLHGKPKSVSPVRVLALTPDTSCPSPPVPVCSSNNTNK